MNTPSDGNVPPGLEAVITADLEQRGLDLETLGPADPTLALADEDEQYYLALARSANGEEVRMLYFATRADDEWEITHEGTIER